MTMSKIETLGNRDDRDIAFETVKKFSTVKTYFLKLLRSRVSIKTISRQIDTHGPAPGLRI